MAVIFNQVILHQGNRFLPGVPVAFDHPLADAYFVGAGWAETTDAAPVTTYEGIEIDPETTIAGTGRRVLEGEA